MNLIKLGRAAGIALLVSGCAHSQPETRYSGVRIPTSWVERAERGPGAGDGNSGVTQAQACRRVSKELRDVNRLEALRFLLKGAGLRDGECCLQYLSSVEGDGIHLAQRLYARLYIENLLAQGAIRTEAGADVTLDLHYQLCWAWRCAEPRSPGKAHQVLKAMLDLGLTPELEKSDFLRQMIAEAGMRTEAGPDGRIRRRREEVLANSDTGRVAERFGWLPSAPDALDAYGVRGDEGGSSSAALDTTVWGGGSDKFLLATHVLVFLVNTQGEPSFRGRALWIRNCGTATIYYSSPATGHVHRELAPGAEELQPVTPHSLDENQSTTGIPLTIRLRAARTVAVSRAEGESR